MLARTEAPPESYQTVPTGGLNGYNISIPTFCRFVISLNSSRIVVYVVKSLHLLFIQMLSLSYTAHLGKCSYRTLGSRHSRSGPAVPNPHIVLTLFVVRTVERENNYVYFTCCYLLFTYHVQYLSYIICNSVSINTVPTSPAGSYSPLHTCSCGVKLTV